MIHCGAAARDPAMHHRFQSADLNYRVIRWVNSDHVTHILPKADFCVSAQRNVGNRVSGDTNAFLYRLPVETASNGKLADYRE